MYRKSAGMTITELSKHIYKSKSTVSKYENGEVSMDIETLFDIADALKISVTQLTDFYRTEITDSIPGNALGFFKKTGYYYMYYYDGILNQTISCVLEIIPSKEDRPPSANMYLGVRDYENIYSCHSLYYGEASYSDARVIFVLQNQTNKTEKIYINVINPLTNAAQTFGILCGISMHYFVPVSYKALFSYSPLKADDIPIEKLRFSKEEIKSIKKHNALLIMNDSQSV